jgi:murein DD-endopeptidase MepM/ murein hydrolase activator NlpD
MFSEEKLFDFYVFKTDNELKKILQNIEKLKEKNKKTKAKNIFEKQKTKRKNLELEYQKNFIEKILNLRKEKFSSPVIAYKISNKRNKIPNAGRPYRATYTDGIHHGWDVMAPLGTKVQALAYGKIIRIIRDFKFSDLNKIKRTNLTFDQKTINLDILR